MKYLIKNRTGKIISSNLNVDDMTHYKSCNKQVEVITIDGVSYRQGKIINEYGEIYMITTDKSITNRIFKRYIETATFFLPHIENIEKQIKNTESLKTRRLKHNIVTYNSHILQEFYRLIPQEELAVKGFSKQLENIKKRITNNLDFTAKTLLRILKNANLEKAELDVYDKINKTNPSLTILNHSIHKVILVSLNTFWLDFLEKDVFINLTESSFKIRIDYNSISVAIGHILENAVKYVAHRSEINIEIENGKDCKRIIFDMISLKIHDYELKSICEENYSGEWARKLDIAGNGQGFYIVSKLLELNGGRLIIKKNVDKSKQIINKGIPYENNIFIFEFE